ncbi:hypothetical protein OBBRIDRAFT_812806 [Obba rivulosa]|uniref:DASH complex subunit DAD2 n=1 Tax=Obba rivulosa TaxID=1052685 RepID=A0A8E2DKA8_9APHY|nr:hypothetical protein OBBRIDRAFT_812806 [Obba rivulosa]
MRGAHSSGANAAATTKLLEKKKELEAVAALERASAKFTKLLEDIGDDFEVMADAGRVHGQVLEQWPNMFRILGLCLAARESASGAESHQEVTMERLVRVPAEELQPSHDNKT